MKSLLSICLLAAALAVVKGAPLEFSSSLAGHYRGSLSIVLGGTAIAGSNFTTEVTVPESGRQVAISLDGFGTTTQGNLTVNLAFIGNLKISSNRRVVADNALLAYNVQLPATGRALGKKTLSYTLLHQDSFNGNVAMTYMLRFQGKRLLIRGTGVANGSPVSVSFFAKKRGR